MSKILGISELALWVKDIDQAVAFYRDILGFSVQEIAPGKNAFLTAGDLLLVLFNPDSPGTPLALEYISRVGKPQGDVYHVAYRIDPAGLDAFAQDVVDKGVEVRGPVEFPSGRRSYFVEDPDRHYIELTDR